MIRATLDTNVLVSAFLIKHGKPAQILNYARARQFQLVLSEDIFAETHRALNYKHIQKRFHPTAQEIDEFIERVRSVNTLVHVARIENVIPRDPPDNRVLACALEGAVNYLVSGNDHLLVLHTYHKIQIVTPARFLEILGSITKNDG